MHEENGMGNGFIGYEYHSVTVANEMESVYTDGYENFGWIREEALASLLGTGTVNMKFKRDRKIRNKAELTRLQRQFDACANEIVNLEKSKSARASITAFVIGILGCAFIAGAFFSFQAGFFPMMVLLAIPGFLGWILTCFAYQRVYAKRSCQIAPLIEKKQDEIYDVCEKASQLLA